MERPDPGKPFMGPRRSGRIVARTQSLEEADRIAEDYRLRGFDVHITRSGQGSVVLYEVWVSKEQDTFQIS